MELGSEHAVATPGRGDGHATEDWTSWSRTTSDAAAPDGRTGKVSVVIPAKNEERSITCVLRQLPDWVYEVILVDGLSADATLEVARHHYPEIRVVTQQGRGKGDALRQGFRHCRGDFIVALDADGSMDAGEIGRYIEALEDGADYVKGSRKLAQGGSSDLTRLRSVGNWVLGTLANLLHGCRYTDLCYGFFAFRRGTVDALPLRSDGFEIETEINIKAHKAGLRIVEVPSYESERHSGRSNLHPLRDGLRVLRTIIRELFGDTTLPATADERGTPPAVHERET